MRFSIILPSLLMDYPGSATGKDQKLIRAINSCLNQTFTDFELIVVADGCALTRYLVSKHFTDERVKSISVDRKQLFSNVPRNAGIEAAQGEYIIYIDSDDVWGTDHLKIVNDALSGEDWVYFNDLVLSGDKWMPRPVDVTQYGRCGTSNICHAARLNLRWKDSEAGYGHDFLFIQQLNKFPGKNIGPAEYQVCHVGNVYCV
jgi:glycosyltransferase involved in cell wall biosynthesis